MLCDKCKTNEAICEITMIVNGETQIKHLCADCVRTMNLGIYQENLLAQILAGILGRTENGLETEQNLDLDQVVCPSCGTSYAKFAKESKFGCADCYATFGILMKNSILELQGSDHHIGKRPKYQETKPQPMKPEDRVVTSETELQRTEQQKAFLEVDVLEQLQLLQSRLMEALQEEDYEAAANYRDEIRKLEGKEE